MISSKTFARYMERHHAEPFEEEGLDYTFTVWTAGEDEVGQVSHSHLNGSVEYHLRGPALAEFEKSREAARLNGWIGGVA
jgi:hypothetical protein